MKNTALIAYMAASAAVVSATGGETGGVTINPDGTYTCAKANAAYCAGDSLKTDIIIRCYGTRGQAGRCSDNLAGEPPVGNTPALCYQTSNEAGDAACEKNCVVYGGSGNGQGTFTLPAEICTPTYTATSSAVPSSTSIPSYPVSSTTSEAPESSKTYPPQSSETYPPHSSKSHYTSKEDCTTDESTSYPTSIPTTGYPVITPSIPSSVIYPTINTTYVTSMLTVPPEETTPTAVPTGPATSAAPTEPVPAGAVQNSAAGGALAVVAFVAAYIL